MKHPLKWQDYVRRLVVYLQVRMVLTGYTVNVDFKEKPHPDDIRSDRITQADIMVDYQYLKAAIRVFPSAYTMWWKKKDWQSVADALAHELAHIITTKLFDRLPESEQTDEAEKELDQATQQIAMIVMASIDPAEITLEALTE